MAETYRFSPRSNRAHEIGWREWNAAAFEEANRTGLLVFLHLNAVWCHWCHLMDETTFSDPEAIELFSGQFIPVRVDADRYPHVRDRYIAGGWPTNAFLTPTGEVLWAGTFVETAELLGVARGVVAAWKERRAEFETEIERRRRALDASRSRHAAVGLVRREAADDVLTAAIASFDARNGGFGEAPKFPQPQMIELLYARSRGSQDDDPARMARHTLDGMLAGELWDPLEGGFFRYAMAADWTEPRREKLLEVNAQLLRAYTLGAHLRDQRDWRETAARTVQWVERRLALPNGLWAGSVVADPDYDALTPDRRAGRDAPSVDDTIYTDACAAWIGALATAGGRLGEPEWVSRAAAALVALQSHMAAPDGGLYHYRPEGDVGAVPLLLGDVLAYGAACLDVAQASGAAAALTSAREMARFLEHRFWAGDGGFWDRAEGDAGPAALRYRERPFEANAEAARFMLDLASATGQRSYRALAERVLALLSPQAGRYGVAGAVFALAVEEFFSAPVRVVVVGAERDGLALREAALREPLANRRVWSLSREEARTMLQLRADAVAVAFACGPRGVSAPVTEPAGLEAAIAEVD